jgi:hypothetical protein
MLVTKLVQAREYAIRGMVADSPYVSDGASAKENP